MFGVDVVEFDAGLGLQLRLEEEPEDLPSRLAAVHADLVSAGKRCRSAAEKFYNRPVTKFSYAIGDRVLISSAWLGGDGTEIASAADWALPHC
jgi:hypothetical protein